MQLTSIRTDPNFSFVIAEEKALVNGRNDPTCVNVQINRVEFLKRDQIGRATGSVPRGWDGRREHVFRQMDVFHLNGPDTSNHWMSTGRHEMVLPTKDRLQRSRSERESYLFDTLCDVMENAFDFVHHCVHILKIGIARRCWQTRKTKLREKNE